MQQLRRLAAAAAVLVLPGCDDQPTQPSRDAAPSFSAAKKIRPVELVGEVTGTVTTAAGQTGTFTGTEQIVAFALDEAGALVARVRVVGRAVVGNDKTRIDELVTVPVQVPGVAAAGDVGVQQLACPILDLDIGAIHLDLLGLVIDLAPVHLDIVAEPGAGNLLGNLLCAIVGLLDLPGALAIILQLLEVLNELLG